MPHPTPCSLSPSSPASSLKSSTGGTGRPLVFLAGLGDTAHVFDKFAPKLSGKSTSTASAAMGSIRGIRHSPAVKASKILRRTYKCSIVYISGGTTGMAVSMTSIRLDTNLADEAAKILGVKSRTEAIHVALSEIVALKRFKSLMNKQSGKLSFNGYEG